MKNHSSMSLESRDAFISSIQKMERVRKHCFLEKTPQGKSWRYQWRRQSLAKWEQTSAQTGFGKNESETTQPNKVQKTKHACIVEAQESTGKRAESSLPRDHEDHIAEKGFNSIHHYNLVHKFIPMLQAMKTPEVKAAANKEWKKLE